MLLEELPHYARRVDRKHGNGASSAQPQEIMPIVVNPEQEQTRQLQRDERVNRLEVKPADAREGT